MTPENKAKLLAAFDALDAIASGGVRAVPDGAAHHSHGGSAFCDLCAHSLASGTPHTCPIGQATSALLGLVPPWNERAVWLADGNLPASPESR